MLAPQFLEDVVEPPFFDQRFMRVYMVCRLPKRLGKPRHWQLCSATYKIAFKTVRFGRLTLPRWRGRTGSIRRYCCSVISIHHSMAAFVS